MTEYRRDKILPEDLIQRTNLSQHNFMIDAINDIDERQGNIGHITNVNIDDITDLKTDVVALSDEKLDKADIDEDIHFGPITITKDGTAVIASLEAVNPTTGAVTPLSFLLPGATSTDAGVMDASSVSWIEEAEQRISALEGLSDVKAVADLPDTPTQAQLTTEWVAVAGKSLETGDILQDINNSKLWVFVGDTWVLYGTIVTVPLATTSTIGGVRDTSLTAPGNRWYSHVEADGRLALIGGDSLSTLLDTTIPAIQSGVNNSVKKSGDTMTGLLRANGGIFIAREGTIALDYQKTNSSYNSPWSRYRNDRTFDKDMKAIASTEVSCANNDSTFGRITRHLLWAVNYNDAGDEVNANLTISVTGNGEGFVTVPMRDTPGSSDVVNKGYLDTRLTSKQDTLTFDNAPTSGSTNPVTSGGVYTALDTKQDGFSLYEHTVRVTGTQSGGEIISFSLTVLNQSPTAFTLQTLRDYLGSASDDYKQASGITQTGAQMNVRYIIAVRGGMPTEFVLETVNPNTGSINSLSLGWEGGYTVTLADKVRQIV